MAKNKNMIRDTFLSFGDKNNKADEERMKQKCDGLAASGWEILSVEYGEIPQSGSAVPGAQNFGKTEPGWTIKVQRPHPEVVPKHAKTRRARRDLDSPSRWLWEEWD